MNKTGEWKGSSSDTITKVASGEVKLCPQCKHEMTKSASVCNVCGSVDYSNKPKQSKS